VRNEESVRIVRRGHFELSVCGPRWKRAVYQFRSELELSAYQAGYEQRLVNDGFTFEAFRKDRRRGQRPAAVQQPKARAAVAYRSSTVRNRDRGLLQRVR
jgi:hypothetical protein